MRFTQSIVSFLVGALCISGCQTNQIGSDTRPNIIYILADDLGYGDLGCFGQEKINTPHLDQMAKEGIKFTNHYTGSTVCAPSRCALMTGYHMGHASMRANGIASINAEDVTVAEILQQAGYRTGLIGKWGLGDHETPGSPLKQGFDFFYGFLNQIRAHNYYTDYLWRNDAKEQINNSVVIADSTYAKDVGSAAREKNEYVHDLFSQEAIQFIEDSKDHPFFLYYAITIPHANNEYWLTSDHGMEVPEYGIYENEEWPEVQKGTAAMITYLDQDIGSILNKLKELGIDENTLVIFTSDNGPHAEGGNDPDFFDSNGPLRGMKRDLYEGGIRTPFIARWPGQIPEQQESDHISAFWDFLPTACEIASLEKPIGIDGMSYLPTLLGATNQVKHDHLYWEFYEQGGKQAIRYQQWKGVRLGLNEDVNPALELYNIEQDPGESNNVAGENPELAKLLVQKMDSTRSRWGHMQFAMDSK